MKNNLWLLIFIVLLGSCQPKRFVGTYVSACTAYHKSNLILICHADSSFEYKFLYNPDTILGRWAVKKDTLILFSDYFSLKNDYLWKLKNTDLEGVDEYLLKKKKLFIINSNGVEQKCPLVKTVY